MKELTKENLSEISSFEKVIFEAAHNVQVSQARHRQAKFNYARRVSEVTKIKLDYLEFDTSVVCSGKTGIQHCVYQSKENHMWPRCVFCGSPKYGD